jgi:hypothetical protein
VTSPEIDDFRVRVEALAQHRLLRGHLHKGVLSMKSLELADVVALIREDAAYNLLLSASGMTRTSVKAAMRTPEAMLVPPRHRRAFVIKQRLPHQESFDSLVRNAVAMRSRDLARKGSGSIEGLFRERLIAEAIPIVMSPPIRSVPGVLIGRRKPDGVYPDPATGRPPLVYLEVKNVRRPADDIQKRLYEIAEASVEMKTIYGDLRLTGLGIKSLAEVESGTSRIRSEIRAQIVGCRPVVVALFLCSKADAERYREGAEAFIDRVFFQEEILECIAFLRETIERFEANGPRHSSPSRTSIT